MNFLFDKIIYFPQQIFINFDFKCMLVFAELFVVHTIMRAIIFDPLRIICCEPICHSQFTVYSALLYFVVRFCSVFVYAILLYSIIFCFVLLLFVVVAFCLWRHLHPCRVLLSEDLGKFPAYIKGRLEPKDGNVYACNFQIACKTKILKPKWVTEQG